MSPIDKKLYSIPFIISEGDGVEGLRRLLYLSTYSMCKRFIDILGSLALLALLLPVMLLISILIRLSSPGPAIYCQKRLTDRAKTFTMFKFRTMREDAEAASGAVWADESDPRVIPIGAFLRRTRLDELPQLLNVLTGDMSLVGPRPERPELARTLRKQLPSFHRRTEVRAGLTGLAQTTSGYASCVEGYREKLAWDLLYIKRRSLLLDLLILGKTVAVVLTGRGAR
jgi:lipopolysaccharide/colanic/teichoic acid biosynthesis glycosyltransferase